MIQEINRVRQPSTVAEYLIDRAAFGEHPLGRTVPRPEENLRSFTREAIVAFRERHWAGARGAFLVGNNLDPAGRTGAGRGAARARPVPAPPEFAVKDVRERAALSIYATLLGGSRLFDEIRENGVCATRCMRSTTRSPTSRSCNLVRASNASRHTRACARS